MKVCVGIITGIHGLHGHVKVKSFTRFPEDLFSFGPLHVDHTPPSLQQPSIQLPSLELSPVRLQGDFFISSCRGIKTRTEAEKLKGQRLYVHRSQLPPTNDEEFYFVDLIGKNVVSLTQEPLGIVADVANYGGGDFLIIKLIAQVSSDPDSVPLQGVLSAEATLPFSHEAVPHIDLARSLVTINPDFLLKASEKKETLQ